MAMIDSKLEIVPENVLKGAMDAGLEQVALVGRLPNGELYVAASTPTWETLALFSAAPDEIERLSFED